MLNVSLGLNDVLKYLLEGAAVAAAAFYIPQRKVALNEVAMIAVTAALVFAVLDLFAPSVGSGARQGSGFGIGYGLVGGGDDDDEDPQVGAGKNSSGDDTISNGTNDTGSTDDTSSDDTDTTGAAGTEEPAPVAAGAEPFVSGYASI